MRQLSEDIGYRTVGTREHVLGEQWMLKEVEALKAHCDNLVKKSSHPAIRHLECEVDRQEGSGTHRYVRSTRAVVACNALHARLSILVTESKGLSFYRFDMMDRRVYKNYVNLSNVVFRLSNGSEASKEHAILVNAHLVGFCHQSIYQIGGDVYTMSGFYSTYSGSRRRCPSVCVDAGCY